MSTHASIFKLSSDLAAVVRLLSQDQATLTERVLSALREDIPDYDKVIDPATLRDIRELVEIHIRAWYGALLDRVAKACSWTGPFTTSCKACMCKA